MTETVRAALARGTAVLREAGIEGAARDARWLLAHAMGVSLDRLTLGLPDPVSAPVLEGYDAALAARQRHQPVAQIIGHRLFWGRMFRVTRETLDPRPESETLIEEALRSPFFRVLDLGTGTGCLLLTLLAEQSRATGLGTDISSAALAVAQGNAASLGLSARAVFLQSDWWARVDGQFDLIVCNPPYITCEEFDRLGPEVRHWEPRIALTDGADGLTAYRTLAACALTHLSTKGRLLVEIGVSQAEAVTELLRKEGLGEIACHTDLDGRPRVVSACRVAP